MPMLGRLTVLPVAGIVPWGVTTAPPGRSPARGREQLRQPEIGLVGAVHHASGAQAPGEAGVSAVLGRIRRAPAFSTPRASGGRTATRSPGTGGPTSGEVHDPSPGWRRTACMLLSS